MQHKIVVEVDLSSTLRSPGHEALVYELRMARRASGLTQQEVAEAMGVHQSFIAKIEIGERRIDVIEFLRLTEILSADPGRIILSVRAQST